MKFVVKDFCETVQAKVFIFGMQVDNDVLYRGIANQPTPASKISVKLCKLEYSYLVCRLIMMYCIVGLRTSLLLLILPCICPIFFLSIF